MNTRRLTRIWSLAFLLILTCLIMGCGLLPPPITRPTPDATAVLATAIALVQAATAQASVLPTDTPTSTPTPTASPTTSATPSPTDTPAPTDTPPPTATATPTETPRAPSVELETYTAANLGISIGYPRGWEVEEQEDAVVFTSSGTLTVAGVVKVPGIDADIPVDLLNLLLQVALQSECAATETQHNSTITINNLEWAQMQATCTLDQVPFTVAVYSTAREGAAYFILGGTHSELFDARRETFDAMLASLRFMPGTALPVPGSVAEIMATTPSLADNFSRDEGAWSLESSKESARFYEQGTLHIQAIDDYRVAWSTGDLEPTDFLLEVDVTHIAGPLDNEFGVLFGLVDSDNFYFFAVSSDGLYRLQEKAQGEWQNVTRWTTSDAIHSGEGSSNKLGLFVQGPRIRLLVNDIALQEVTVDAPAAGSIALAAGTFAEGNVEVAFDNLRFWDLGAPAPTATPTSTATPLLPDATVATRALNVRSGPGTVYPVTAGVYQGEALEVTGQASDCGWLQVRTRQGVQGWVSGRADYVTLNLSCSQVAAVPIPPTPARPPRRLATGAFIKSLGRTGLGELTIENGQAHDAVAVLTNMALTPQVSVYVRADDSYTIIGIADGVYRLFFSQGSDWDSQANRFTRDPTYFRFEEPFKFTTTGILGSRQYTTWRVTLYSVPGGTADTTQIGPGQFPGLR